MAGNLSDDVLMADGSVAESVEQTISFFSEKSECLKLVTSLLEVDSDPSKQESDKKDAAVARLETIFDKYQEEPQLLDPELESIVLPLMKGIRSAVIAWDVAALSAESTETLVQKKTEVCAFPFQAYRNPRLDRLLKVVYTLCKVRGRKTVVRLMPHAVSDLEPTLRLLQSQDPCDCTTWKTRYSLLLWLSILVRVPFDLTSIDSLGHKKENSDISLISRIMFVAKSYLDDPNACRDAAAVLVGQLMTRPDLEDTELKLFFEWANDKLQRLIMGNDDEDSINDVTVPSTPHESNGREVFLISGVFHALVEIFKHGHRENVLQHVNIIFDNVLDAADSSTRISTTLQRKMACKLAQRVGLAFLPPRIPKWRYERGQRSLVANLEIFGSSESNKPTKPTNAFANQSNSVDDDEEEDVDQEVEELIEVLLCGLRDKNTVIRWSAAKGIGRITGRLPSKSLADVVTRSVVELITETESDGAWHGACLALAELARRGLLVPERLEQVTPMIVQALCYDERRGAHSVGAHVRDAACYVCWAFARAYSPEVMRPHMLELSRAMLVTATLDREVNCRRAASAAFQENVGRQGHENFAHGIDILTKADYHSLGLRTNSYLNIAPYIAQYDEYRHSLVDHLLHTKLRHWDKELRQLSSRALHNIAPLDPTYFVEVVLPTLIPWTLNDQVFVRHGACLAIAEVVLALSQPPHEHAQKLLGETMLSQIRNITMKVEKARMYRGRGAYLMRESVCRLIFAMAEASHPLSRRAQLRLLKSIFENLCQAREETQTLAVEALGAFSHEYFNTCDSKDSAELIPVVVLPLIEQVSEEVTSVRRGASLGLGALPRNLIAHDSDVVEKVLATLILATQLEIEIDLQDAESRRDAIRGLVGFCCELGVGVGGLSPTQGIRAFDALMNCLNDYSVTDRGDVGSFVRKAAIIGLEKLVTMLVGAELNYSNSAHQEELVKTKWGVAKVQRWLAEGTRCRVIFKSPQEGATHFENGVTVIDRDMIDFNSSETLPEKSLSGSQNISRRVVFTGAMSKKLMDGLLRQACEKIDSVRESACKVFHHLLHMSNPSFLPDLEDRLALERIFPKKLNDTINWSSMAQTTPYMQRVLHLPSYRFTVASGLAISCGLVNTRTTVAAASEAFIAWTRDCENISNKSEGAEAVQALSMDLLTVLRQHAGDNRVIIPVLQTLTLIMDKGWCNALYPPFSFWENLRDIIKNEVNSHARDALKLIAVVSTFHALLSFPGPARSEAVRGLLVFMLNSFPKIRRLSAQKLFEALCADPEFLENESVFEKVIGILSNTAWDQDIDKCRAERNELYPLLLGIPAPKIVERENMLLKKKKKENEFGYADLVRDMHSF